MTFTTKGTRKVEVQNERFLWRLRKLTYRADGMPLGAAIQHGDGGALLMAAFGLCHAHWYHHSGPTITPAIIRRCVALAIERGWQFREKGPHFVLDGTGLLEEPT